MLAMAAGLGVIVALLGAHAAGLVIAFAAMVVVLSALAY
jgi:hypothetical protein